MSPWLGVLALVVFGAVLTASSRPVSHRLTPLAGAAEGPRRRIPRPVAGIVATVACVWWVVAGQRALVLLAGLGVAVAGAVVRRLTLDWRVRRRRGERQRAVIELCDSLSSELRAGLPAARALERSCEQRPEWAGIVTAARLGGDVVEAMRLAAEAPGAAGLRAVAAGWDVAGRSGAGLATVLERIAAGLRSDDEARSEVIASLGPPRATAKMLAALPVFGLALGVSMGARPVAFLLRTDVGLACLASGLVLGALGVAWVEHLAASAEI